MAQRKTMLTLIDKEHVAKLLASSSTRQKQVSSMYPETNTLNSLREMEKQ